MEVEDGSGLPVNAVFTVTFANITHHGVQGGVPGQKAQFLGSQKLLRTRPSKMEVYHRQPLNGDLTIRFHMN